MTYANTETVAGDGFTRRRRPLSPDQIRHMTLSRTGLGRRGYVEHDVDLLLSRIAADIEGWIAETTAVRAENDRLKQGMREWQSRFSPLPGGGAVEARPSPDAVQVLSRAQQEADSLVAQAQDYARRVTEYARQQYEDVLRAAQRQAHEQAEQAVRQYRVKAGQQYRAEFEELERRLAWARTFLGAIQSVEAQLRAAREGLQFEVERLGSRPGIGEQVGR